MSAPALQSAVEENVPSFIHMAGGSCILCSPASSSTPVSSVSYVVGGNSVDLVCALHSSRETGGHKDGRRHNILCEALNDHHTSVSIRWSWIWKLLFCRRHWSDSRHQQRITKPYQQTDRQLNAYGMEISTNKSEVMVIGKGKVEMYMNRVCFREIKSFKCLEATLGVDWSYFARPGHHRPQQARVASLVSFGDWWLWLMVCRCQRS